MNVSRSSFDGTEVVQHEQGAWRGRFLHPELGRLIESLAEEPMPGVLALTTRFELRRSSIAVMRDWCR